MRALELGSLRQPGSVLGVRDATPAQYDVMGRPRSCRLIESVSAGAITARQLLPPEVRSHLDGATLTTTPAPGETLTMPLASLVDTYQQRVPWPPGQVRRWLLLCPRCGHRRRALFLRRSGFGCRVCFKLRYQSSSGRWDFPLVKEVLAHREILDRRPGPKSRALRAWHRRVVRIQRAQERWAEVWAPRLRRWAGSEKKP